MKAARAGQYRNRLLLQNPAQLETFDSFGQPQTEAGFTDLAIVFCAFRPLSGRELVQTMQTQSQAAIYVEFRWMGTVLAISPETRGILNGVRKLGFVRVDNVEMKNRLYQCWAYEWQQAGPV